MQDNKPLAYYSRKLNSAQKRYTMHEKELLSIVEILKEYKNILFGYKLEVFTDHENLVHETLLLSSDRVMRWRLLLEEYSPTFHWIKGEKNIVADSMSRLPTVASTDEIVEARDEVFATDLDVQFPMAFDNVRKEQQSEINRNKETRKKVSATIIYLIIKT